MNELLKRVIVGVIGIPVGLGVIYLGKFYFFAAIFIISLIGLWEFYKMAKAKGDSPMVFPGLIFLAIFITTLYYYLNSTEFLGLLGILSTTIYEILAAYIVFLVWNLFSSKKNAINNFSTTLSGLFYVYISFGSLLFLRYAEIINVNERGLFIIAYFASIWICDSAAYFIGRKWGQHKIAPKISPKKSWEGGIAGLIASVLSFVLISVMMNLHFPIVELITYGLIIGVLGQMGDFIESGFKRDAGVKDSSSLLSEHGGILDRFDSIMFTAPAILLVNIIFSM
ncbi:MAG: hypothetical protein A2X64_11130 [Ignavibacteria bacterium GWF2_33_9]|nr:MAG: hypothetical protein A2X64_11130 [Ignavibacteria bacterium GWF2_33_9]